MLSNHLMVNVQLFRDGGGEGLSDNDSLRHADDNESGATSSARRDYVQAGSGCVGETNILREEAGSYERIVLASAVVRQTKKMGDIA